MRRFLAVTALLALVGCGPVTTPEPPAPTGTPALLPGFKRVQAEVTSYCGEDDVPTAFAWQVIVTGAGLDGTERMVTRNGITVPFAFMVRRVTTDGVFVQSIDYPQDMDPTVVTFVATTGFVATRGCAALLEIREPGNRYRVLSVDRPDQMDFSEVTGDFGALVLRSAFMLPPTPRG